MTGGWTWKLLADLRVSTQAIERVAEAVG